jgi:hypothetical protein
MKIGINVNNVVDLINDFSKISKLRNHNVISLSAENTLFEHIENMDIDAYVISDNTTYYKKAIDFIKKSNPHIPIIVICYNNKINISDGDIYIPTIESNELLSNIIIYNLEKYNKTFESLQRLTAKTYDKIEFANCIYDPTNRILYHKNKEIQRLSSKEGGILEILAMNFGTIVKKDIILEKVWHKSDYFVSRSMDVYLTYLRNIIKENNIKLTIKNISGIGIIME